MQELPALFKGSSKEKKNLYGSLGVSYLNHPSSFVDSYRYHMANG